MPSYRSGLVARTVLAALVAACGTAEETTPEPEPEPLAPFDPPSVESAWEMELPALRDAVRRTMARAQGAAGSEAGVADSIAAAALCRVMSVRDPAGDWIDQARAQLTEASRRRAVPGACAASLELARLEARDSGRPRAAYRVAFRASLRFATTDADCAAAAEAMLPTLAPWSPSASELAAIRADPDGDGPDADEPGRDLMAEWAREHAGEAAQLRTLFVYGHEALPQSAAVRVVLGFDRVVAYEHGEAPASGERPRQTWLQLASVTPGEGVASQLPVDSGGLTRIRVRSENGGTRVTFELAAEARFRAFVLPEPFRIVLDIELGGAHSEGPIDVIVLDPGHGGDDFGARAFGLRESDLTLDLALRVRALLARRLPDVRVVLTRQDDTLVELEQRSALANALSADLFLSIHLNGFDEQVERGGVTTFVLDTSDDRQALRLAARENGTTVAEVDSLARLLASLHRADQVEASRAFAEQIQRATLAAGRRHLPQLHDRHVRSALFHVLVGARMPAVLLEASFLSQEDEADALRTTEYRQALADGIAEGIVRWAGG